MRILVRVLCAVALVAISIMLLNFAGNSHGSGISRRGSRVQSEIMEMETALESYKADHGRYPSDPDTTERLKTKTTFDAIAYIPSSEFLYRALSGELEPNVENPGTIDGKRYYDFKPEMLRTAADGHVYVVDPFGNSYGYSTVMIAHPESADGYNPTFDLWSTGGKRRQEDQAVWAKNW